MFDSEHAENLAERIMNKTAVVAVVGMGYVGLPLVRAIHDGGYRVFGYDVDSEKIDKLRGGRTYIKHLGEDFFRSLSSSDRFTPTNDSADLAEADVVILCVPTPLGEHRDPDLQFVLESTRTCAKNIQPGQLFVLESTTYPGTTREEMLPILEESGLTCGRDFFLAYSPEREDPGTTGRSAVDIPKLIGAIEKTSTILAELFYSRIIKSVCTVSSAEVAEAAKLLENIYRAVNIALVNELKTLLTEMNVDVWEVIEAASTKPFGFSPFFPGPGLGGHCIPIDPFYLSWKAASLGRNTKFIELAGEINSRMPEYVVSRLTEALNQKQLALRNAKVLLIGIAYKKNIDDIRETPAAEIISLLQKAGAHVSYHDPHMPMFPSMRKFDIDLRSIELTPACIRETDAVLIVTDHDKVDYELIDQHAQLIVDTRNAMARVKEPKARIVKA